MTQQKNVADSATQDPQAMMEQAARLLEEQQKKEAQARVRQYEASPQGKLEQKYASKLPTYDPSTISIRHERGGFYNSEYDVEGLPARLIHKFVPRSQLAAWSELYRPIDPADVSMHEADLAKGKVYVRRAYQVIHNMVCTGETADDMVMVIADRESYEKKINDRTGSWNDRFSRTAPVGQTKANMESSEPGRQFMVDSTRFDQAELSGTLLSPPGEGE